MAFPPGFLDEIRSRIALGALVGRHVKLTRRGREQVGLCPFHREKTPSFYVVEDKAFFHCFGCGAHGDAIGFVMRVDNLDFIEAVEKLAHEAGLAVPQASREERREARRQKTLLEAIEAACAFYEVQLEGPRGRRARDYLQERGLDADTIRRFRLGWAPGPRTGGDGRALYNALAADFPEALLCEAGLLRQRPSPRDQRSRGDPEEGGDLVDYFRDRVTFPIGDRAGRIIAFGGRVLPGSSPSPSAQPKYLNSPDNPLFAKGHVLYGWAAARAAAARDPAASVILTEGYMDVIALHRAGFATAVAPLGTALSEVQLAEVWRLSPEPVLCFDGDEAGQRAAIRAMRRALPLLRPGHSLRFATLPAGEDPDSLIRLGGRERFEQVLAAARPLSRMLWEVELAVKPADTPERRADLERRLIESVGAIGDRAVRAKYERFIRDQLFELARPVRRPNRRVRQQSAFVRDGPPPPLRAPGRVERENLFRLLLHHPELIEQVAEEFVALSLPEPEFDRLRRAILEAVTAHPGLDARTLRQHLLTNGFATTVETLSLPSVDTGFLVRCADPLSVRKAWTHLVRMLTTGDRTGFSEASKEFDSDFSDESWERYLAARQRVVWERLSGDDDPPPPADPV
ncbi:MAG TPA: DNA primase [Stellaceae bacterium]|nr:DNA primase [Stellaceae bacterium]